MTFHKDPNNKDEMICDECFHSNIEIKQDWMDIDDDEWDFWKWDEDADDEDEDDWSTGI